MHNEKFPNDIELITTVAIVVNTVNWATNILEFHNDFKEFLSKSLKFFIVFLIIYLLIIIFAKKKK
ncbi:MAG: hypothetical protein K2K73_01070, partial [Ureaplasma sp.]|nr:hypothetical protein [Ureaplasma sp.]